MTDSPCYAHFDFDLARAVLEQLVEAFRKLDIGDLEPVQIEMMESGQGVYQLFLDNELMYIGKADNLPKRLERHFRRLSARQNIQKDNLGFKALYIHKNWTTWTTEEALINFLGENSPWNTSGFGSNDPGRNRDHTAEVGTFNSQYPIDPDIVCDWLEPGRYTAWDLLIQAKKHLPYLLRFQRLKKKSESQIDKDAQHELMSTSIRIEGNVMTARELLKTIASQLPEGWQATQLPGRLIFYKENAEYQHGQKIWPEV